MKIRPVIGRTLLIGRQGENGAVKVDFNDIIDNFINDFGEGEAIVMIQRPGEEVIYPVNLVNGIWTVTSTDTAKKGEGKAQISFYKNDVLAKSVVIKTKIKEGLGAIGSVPEPGKDFIEELIKKVGKSGITIEKVEKVEGGYTLKLSSGEVLQIKNGGNGAKGEDGKDGVDGTDGVDGVSPIVKIEEIENGKRVIITDKDGEKSFDILNGENGENGKDGENGKSPTVEVIEENNGNRVTFKDNEGVKSIFIKNGKDGETGPKGEDGKDGLKGEDGTDGSDGFSPTVKIEEIENGKKLIITDKDGEKSFTILNGKDGVDGTKGENGKDGNDGAAGVSPTIKIEDIENGQKVIITDKDGDKSFSILNGKDGADGQAGAKGEDGKDGVDGVSPTIKVVDKNIIVKDKNGEKSYALPTGDGSSSSGVELIDTNLFIKDGENVTDIIDLRSNETLTIRGFTKEQAVDIKTKLYKIAKKFAGVRQPDVNLLQYAKLLGIDVSVLDESQSKYPCEIMLGVLYTLMQHKKNGVELDKDYLMIPNISEFHEDLSASISSVPWSIEDQELKGKLDDEVKAIQKSIQERAKTINNYFFYGADHFKITLGDPNDFLNGVKEKLNGMYELLSHYQSDDEEVENYKKVLKRDLSLTQPMFNIDLFFGLNNLQNTITSLLRRSFTVKGEVEDIIKTALGIDVFDEFGSDLLQKALVNILTNSDDIKELIRKVVNEQ